MKLWRFHIQRTSSSAFAIRRTGQATRWPAIEVCTPLLSISLSRSVPRDLRAAPCPREDDHCGHVWPSRHTKKRGNYRHRACMGRPS